MKKVKTIGMVAMICLASFGAVALGIIAVNVFDGIWYRDRNPPKGLHTVQEFRKWKPQYTNAYRVSVRGSIYYLIEGEFARSLPSGPSAFVFDEHGNFVEWTSDCDDYYHPRIVFSKGAKRERINPSELPNEASQAIGASAPQPEH